jgi:hypothetical protein
MKNLDEAIIQDFIIQDFTYRFIIDDVSEGKGEEFRCSIYDAEMNICGEGWASTTTEATLDAMKGTE